MRIPLSWLREYVDFETDARTLAHDLTMSGTKIEGVHVPHASFEGVYIGKVVASQQHPNADKLSVCRVDVGGEELRIVCGAPNVRAGLTVVVAKVGARLAGGVKIRKSKIRGEVSQGMICSARELELGADAAGILELEASLKSGDAFTGLAAADDTVLEAEITPNRPDCLSMLGIAREVAALYGGALKRPGVWSGGADGASPIRVEIDDPEDCARYLGRAIRNVRVEPSPEVACPARRHGTAADQQRRRRDELRAVRNRSAHPCLRPGPTAWRPHRRASRARGRNPAHAGRGATQTR
jgi:phenylalanyl-tRNA synthetase beta chain